MKKRKILSSVLAAAMVLSMVPATALAAGDDGLSSSSKPQTVTEWWTDRSEPNGWVETGAGGVTGEGYITITNDNDGKKDGTTDHNSNSTFYRWEGKRSILMLILQITG